MGENSCPLRIVDTALNIWENNDIFLFYESSRRNESLEKLIRNERRPYESVDKKSLS